MMDKIRYTIATLVGLFAVWYGLSLRPEAQTGWTEPYVYDFAKEVMPSECEDIANASTGRVRSIRGTRNGVIPPGGDSDALGRTKHWDVEEILGQ